MDESQIHLARRIAAGRTQSVIVKYIGGHMLNGEISVVGVLCRLSSASAATSPPPLVCVLVLHTWCTTDLVVAG